MVPQAVANVLWGWAKIAAKAGVEVDATALAAVNIAAIRVAPIMQPQHVANILWAYSKLAENEIEVGRCRLALG